MAGHNKWSKIKHAKAGADAKRSKLFSQFSKEITVAARLGGDDPDMNPRLRTAVNNAKKQSMPSDNIERAIKKGAGDLGSEVFEEILYEGYGPQGTAFLVKAATDNKNRTAADVRSAFNKNEGSIGTPNSVAYNFDHIGEIRFPAEDLTEDQVMEAALEAGAEDFAVDGDEFVVRTALTELYQVSTNLEQAGLPQESAQLVYQAQTSIEISDSELAAQVIKLWDALEELDDVQNVFANVEFTDAALESGD